MRRECLALSLFALACDQAPEMGERPELGDLVACFGVVGSDYASASVSLLDCEGNVLADDYIHSGSTPSGLVTTLSGDVSLPSQRGEPGVLVLIDRYKTDVVTRIRLHDGVVLGQVRTHTPPSQATTASYSSNPQDYLYVDEHTAWVTRYEPNIDPDVAPMDRGTDMLRIDPSRMERTTDRIDLSVFNTTATRVDPVSNAQQEVDIFARPTGMLRVGDQAVVGLGRFSFDHSTVGPGEVALVDLESGSTHAVSIEGLSNCSDLSPVPDQRDAVVVGCIGPWQGGNRRASAGVALLRIGQGSASVEHIWRASEHLDQPLAVDTPVSLGGTRMVVVASGSSATHMSPDNKDHDTMYVFDIADGARSELFASEDSFVIGSSYFDVERKLLIVPDASTDANGRPNAGLRRFRLREDGTLQTLEMVRVGQGSGIPPRDVKGI